MVTLYPLGTSECRSAGKGDTDEGEGREGRKSFLHSISPRKE